MSDLEHNRKNLRMKGYDYDQYGYYFVTVCVKNKECLFGELINEQVIPNELGNIIINTWFHLKSRFLGIELDEFTLMPNHIHGIIILNEMAAQNLPSQEGAASSAPTLGDVMCAFKSISAIQCNKLRNQTGPLWQRNYYEHIIRNEDSLLKIREYIRNNPLQWALDKNNPQNIKLALPPAQIPS
ncbi:transposase [bacterium]|nr:transposase [bacterium]